MEKKLSTGEKSAGSPVTPVRCRNCGQEVPERYCSRCGQAAKEVRVSLKLLLRDVVSEFLTYDSKFVRTVILLFFRPGFLTHAFLEGKRVRYVRPLRLYLLSGVLFFLTLSFVSRAESDTSSVPRQAAPNAVAVDNTSAAAKTAERAGNNRQATLTEGRLNNDTWYGRYLNARLDAQDRKFRQMGPDAFMESLVGEFLSSLPKALFLLMPLFALMLKLCYLRSDPLYVDHLIFGFHYHAFIYAMGCILLLLGSLSEGLMALSIVSGFVVCPTYLLLAMKKVYAQSWPWTVFKLAVTSTIYFTSLMVFLLALFILSAVFFV